MYEYGPTVCKTLGPVGVGEAIEDVIEMVELIDVAEGLETVALADRTSEAGIVDDDVVVAFGAT